jgi:hypothetical protein
MGRAAVNVDGMEAGVLDGVSPGYDWLGKGQGWVSNKVIAAGLSLSPHVLSFTLLNESTYGGHHFQVIGIAIASEV